MQGHPTAFYSTVQYEPVTALKHGSTLRHINTRETTGRASKSPEQSFEVLNTVGLAGLQLSTIHYAVLG